MKRTLAMLALLIGLAAGSLSAQTRVSVSLSFGAPFVAYHPRPYGYGHSYRYRPHRRYVVYDPRPTIVVVRPYRPTRLVVVRHRPRRHHHRW